MTESEPSLELAAMELFERAMEQAPDDREAFIANQSGEEEAVKNRALALLEADRNSVSSLRTGGAASLEDDDDHHPEQIGAYRILRLLGKGGMGAVYLGERASDDFDHVVAIKLVKPGLLSDSLIERFRRERQILAQLNHQHIAHLHDGGETDDGSPYIVMEFVDGVPLSEWISDGNRSLEQRLDLFLQICDAVEFAHQNLVIHRDLTPSNVLIAAGDQAKLIDFGIARPQADDGNETAPSTFSGLSLTPGFAAPERSQGTETNTLSDIYSLGHILAVLIKEDNEPELDAIAAKAASHDPENRYSTAQGLSNDVRNYRGNSPVSAYSDRKRYRFRKFIARQKLAVGATAAVILLLLAGLVGTGWAYSQAEKARAETDQRFAETRAIAKIMMFDVFDEVSKVPGSTKARAILAETAQQYLDSLAAGKLDSVDVQLDAGKGYFRLYRATGGSQGASLGKLAEGKLLLERSRKILAQLFSVHPERDDVRTAYGKTLTIVAGETLYTDGELEAAGKIANRAKTILAGISLHDAESANALGTAYYYEAESLSSAGETEKAGALLGEGIGVMAQLPPALLKTLEVKRAQGILLSVLGSNFSNAGKFKEALKPLKDAIELRHELVEMSDGGPADVRNLTISYYFLGKAQLAAGRTSGALESARAASKLSRDAMQKSPDDAGPKELFTGTALLEGEALSALNRHGEATAIADRGIAVNRELLSIFGDVASAPMNFAIRLHEASIIYDAAGRKRESCAIMNEAVKIIKNHQKSAELPAATLKNTLNPILAKLKHC